MIYETTWVNKNKEKTGQKSIGIILGDGDTHSIFDDAFNDGGIAIGFSNSPISVMSQSNVYIHLKDVETMDKFIGELMKSRDNFTRKDAENAK